MNQPSVSVRGSLGELGICSLWISLALTLSSVAVGQSPETGQSLGAEPSVDERLPDYETAEGLESESLRLVGSGTMRAVVTKWGRQFQELYPSVYIEVDKKGSGNAIPALLQGQASFGLMSRPPKKTELAAFKARFGYPPTLIACCIDMLVVFVHKDNPIPGLTFQELDAIFSSSRRHGGTAQIRSWTQLGAVDGKANALAIQCFGRNSASGTYAYFKKHVLRNGDYGNWVAEMVGSSNVTQAIGANPAGIGYSGMGFKNPLVRALPISRQRIASATEPLLVSPTFANAYTGEYPLSRSLYLVVNKDPRIPLPLVQVEFLRYVASKPGQRVVLSAGLVPLRKPMRDQEFLDILGDSEALRGLGNEALPIEGAESN